MKHPRKTYEVYRNGRHVDDTFAVSEAQAINNVRHNIYGDFTSQRYDKWSAVPKYNHVPVIDPVQSISFTDTDRQMSLFDGDGYDY